MRKNSLVAMIRKRVEAEVRSRQDAAQARAAPTTWYTSCRTGSAHPRVGECDRTSVSSWSPMETAPRDATSVLLFVPGHGIYIGHHTSGPNPFWRWSYTHSGRYQRLTPPTHWMPLPDPPRREQSDV